MWFVPFLTAPMLIPLIAIPHIIVAQFAVGGGVLLAYMVTKAHKNNMQEVLSFLKGLSRFFILITIVFGAVSGLGIWWTIGLTSPETTQALINIFVFGWATEWVFFVIEIVSAFCFYYLWDKLLPKDHIILGWIYAISAVFSLIIITGITSFMLTTGNWTPEKGFFTAFFNPSFLPQTFIRTGGSLSISALWIGMYTSFQKNVSVSCKDSIIRWSSKWALFGMVLILIGGLWYFGIKPEYARLNLIRAPILIIFTLFNFAITLVVIVALALGHITGYKWITPPSSILLFMAGAMAITTGEFIREGARKPYRIEKYILSPGVYVKDVESFNKNGFISNTEWLRYYVVNSVMGNRSYKMDINKYLMDRQIMSNINYATEPERIEVGKAIFQYHCASCHSIVGYNGIKPLITPWTPELIKEALNNLHKTNPAMPPWLGNDIEREVLVSYLTDLNMRK